MRDEPPLRFSPSGDYCGCVIKTVKGYRTFDADNREGETFPTADAAAAALIELLEQASARKSETG